jgi:hypothetical protein
VPAGVTYDDIVSAATNAQDLSRQALVTIFGDVVLDPLAAGNTTMIGNLFALFNGIIAVLAVVWFVIIGLKHINKTGHQGKVFSGDRDITSTLSTVSGFLMIIRQPMAGVCHSSSSSGAHRLWAWALPT